MVTPKMNAATPRCATIMPTIARGSWRSAVQHAAAHAAGRPHAFPQVRRHAWRRSRRPSPGPGCQPARCGPRPSRQPSGGQQRHRGGPAQAARQVGHLRLPSSAPAGRRPSGTPAAPSAARTRCRSTAGPTEILPRPSASSTSGYSVPSSTAAMATTSSTLLASSKRLARDQREARAQADLGRAPGIQRQRGADRRRPGRPG